MKLEYMEMNSPSQLGTVLAEKNEGAPVAMLPDGSYSGANLATAAEVTPPVPFSNRGAGPFQPFTTILY